MGNYFHDAYLRRVNRNGTTPQSRVQNQRERFFEDHLRQSVYYTQFEHNGETREGEFTRMRQKEGETLHYLLTRINEPLKSGTIVFLPDQWGNRNPWMVFYLEDIPVSGYNRHIMLRMTHLVEWVSGLDDAPHWTFASFYGQQDNMLKNEVRSRSRVDTLYRENLKTSFFVAPMNEFIKREDYFTIKNAAGSLEAYVVTGLDTQTQPGVVYVTVDPTPVRDETPVVYTEENPPNMEDYWLNGGE